MKRTIKNTTMLLLIISGTYCSQFITLKAGTAPTRLPLIKIINHNAPNNPIMRLSVETTPPLAWDDAQFIINRNRDIPATFTLTYQGKTFIITEKSESYQAPIKTFLQNHNITQLRDLTIVFSTHPEPQHPTESQHPTTFPPAPPLPPAAMHTEPLAKLAPAEQKTSIISSKQLNPMQALMAQRRKAMGEDEEDESQSQSTQKIVSGQSSASASVAGVNVSEKELSKPSIFPPAPALPATAQLTKNASVPKMSLSHQELAQRKHTLKPVSKDAEAAIAARKELIKSEAQKSTMPKALQDMINRASSDLTSDTSDGEEWK